jgi:(1->4)-alpha-D-glucan 1-alpha-D-glucosylmutase
VTQTHDTKRAGDVRARIGALSTMPRAWAERVQRWLDLTESLVVAGAPDRVERYFIFQTLVGAWPIDSDRLAAYMEKALREAKRTTSWIDPDAERERRVLDFCRALYEHEPFRRDFEPFAAEVAGAGDRASLAQLLLKLTVPGVPDVYQGDELLDLSLVDPDNRREVDWDRRRELLEDVMRGAQPTEETRKLWLIKRALTLRSHRWDAFTGAYEPVEAGPDVCAFTRGRGQVLVAAVIRGDGSGVALDLPEGHWRDVLRGGERPLGGRVTLTDLIDEHGLALLERTDH